MTGLKTIVAIGAGLALSGLASGNQEINGVSYCNAVTNVVYKNIQGSGTYYTPSSMECSLSGPVVNTVPVEYGGTLAPLNNQISLFFRGPIQLFNFGYYKRYQPTKRDLSHDHSHAAKHKRNALNHKGKHGSELKKRDSDVVTETATKDVTVTLTHYVGAPTADSVKSGSGPNPTAVLEGAVNDSNYKPKKPTGDWIRAGYYSAKDQISEGLVFLANKGAPGVSGTWTSCFGNSVSFLSANGKDAAPNPETLASGVVFGVDEEFSIWTNQTCTPASGFSYSTDPCYEGFDGVDKVFTFEFQMPTDDSNAGNPYGNSNMPAIWSLNSLIGRTLQYPSNKDWSCWNSGCGEFDIFEVLYGESPASEYMTSHLHSAQGSSIPGQAYGGGGVCDYIVRPTNSIMKGMAAYLADGTISISVLDDSYDFPLYMTDSDVTKAQNDPSASVFNVPG